MRGNIFSPEYLISNGIAAVLLLLTFTRPATARSLLCILFTGAAFFNGIAAFMHPEWYLSYADIAAIPSYERIINGAFSRHITAYVLTIAIGQLSIGIFIGSKGWLQKTALAGAVVFLLAISPLGAGAAFPCTIILAAACVVLLFKHSNETLPEIFNSRVLKHRRPIGLAYPL
ncbi:hypothetical protein GFS24_09330 [Chitinophaga sp. SYP-B3965]|uniref:hypothetical protein n=1 Tax=Chitinophaga sp. SYP-B3965 TaxID=2663120 RepID=UPI001299947F|nr:hypothetical protein [Chitinophaga sp. SYP-B3965]MRG45317.1 hypothetical protein [Chitinophaga sp. SYP-B3965]